jgi:hypothetical protein
MMRAGAATLWILAGAVVTGGVYWALLNTPESTIGALLLSALLATVLILLLGVMINGAIAAWSADAWGDSFRRSIRNTPAVLPAIIIVVSAWWLIGHATAWIASHNGPISAWFIARFGWADVSWLFTGVSWVGGWLRWIAVPLVALSLVAAVAHSGWTPAARAQWNRRAFSPVRLSLATVWFAVLVAAPWLYLAPWRPRGLPANSLEIAFIAIKLSITAVLMAIGVALIVREAARNPHV